MGRLIHTFILIDNNRTKIYWKAYICNGDCNKCPVRFECYTEGEIFELNYERWLNVEEKSEWQGFLV